MTSSIDRLQSSRAWTTAVIILSIWLIYGHVTGFEDQEFIKYCPVSTLIDTEIDGLLSYPVDLFDIEQYKELTRTQSLQSVLTQSQQLDDPSMALYNCSALIQTNAAPEGIYREYRVCSRRTHCPVHENMAEIATAWARQHHQKHSLCYLKEALHDYDSTIKVIVMGGSITRGSYTPGCCCDGEFNPKCRNISMHSDNMGFSNRDQLCWVCNGSLLMTLKPESMKLPCAIGLRGAIDHLPMESAAKSMD